MGNRLWADSTRPRGTPSREKWSSVTNLRACVVSCQFQVFWHKFPLVVRRQNCCSYDYKFVLYIIKYHRHQGYCKTTFRWEISVILQIYIASVWELIAVWISMALCFDNIMAPQWFHHSKIRNLVYFQRELEFEISFLLWCIRYFSA